MKKRRYTEEQIIGTLKQYVDISLGRTATSNYARRW